MKIQKLPVAALFLVALLPLSNLSAQKTDSLKENKINEVVLIGYGKVNKQDLTTAVSPIQNMEQIESRPVSNVGEFLQGQAAGVTVVQSGAPGSFPEIVIRGRQSLNGQPILYVVDGLPYYGPAINPKEIKSISVLKDAASAAIYGAQAAGGVIIIETKTGRKGKPAIELNAFTSFQNATNLPTPLTAEERNQVYNQAYINDGKKPIPAYDASVNPYGAVTRTNWMKEIFRTAPSNGVTATISGAGDNVNYFTSLEYLDKQGVLLGTNYQRYSARAKADINITKKLKTGINLLYSQDNYRGTNTTSGYSGTIINALYMPSSAPVYDENGQFGGTVPFNLSNFSGAYGDVYNPVALLLRPSINDPYKNFSGQTYISYDILKGLSFKSSFGYTSQSGHYKKFSPKVPEIGRSNDENFLNESFSNSNSWVWENQLKYIWNLGRHHFDAIAVYSASQNEGDSFGISAKGFDIEDPYYRFIEYADEIVDKSSGRYKERMNSGIARLMYDFDKRYFLTGSIRRDETSKTNPEGNYQVGYYPSFSAAWRISNEAFFQSNAITNLKLRGSWGRLGNTGALGSYDFSSGLNRGKVVMGADGKWETLAFYLSRRPSNNVTWETIESYDIGLDFELFKNFNLTADYYNKKTIGMILTATPDEHSGLDPENINAGNVENSGFEISASYNKRFGEVGFGVNANLSTNHNEITYLSPEYTRTGNDEVSNNTNFRDVLRPYRNKLHQPLFSYYLIPYMGIFQSEDEIKQYAKDGKLIQPNAKPGDFKFQDVNGDGKIDDKDRVYNGSYNPKLTYALNVNFDYKGFDLGLFFQGISGVKVFNAYKFAAYNPSLNFNMDNRVLNAWTSTNTSTDIPRLSYGDQNKNFSTNSTWYLENGSYLRLKNITLGYDISRFLPEFLTKARIYFSADNLFTITKYSGIDPEVGGIGFDTAQYPVSKIFTFGTTFSF